MESGYRSRLLVVGLIAVIAAAIVVALPAARASGDPAYPSKLRQSVTLKLCTFDGPACHGGVRPVSGSLRMICWEDGIGVPPGPGRWARWFFAEFPNGAFGFVWGDKVDQQARVDNCSTKPEQRAVRWALSTFGQTTASPADTAAFPARSWQPGPVGEWQGDCPKIPGRAWRDFGKRPVQLGDAIQNYNYYKARGLVHPGQAPFGAIVFYSKTALGHTALSVGNGNAIGTVGVDNQKPMQANNVYVAASDPKYLGWVMP